MSMPTEDKQAVVTERDVEEIERRFRAVVPLPAQVETIHRLSTAVKDLALMIHENIPNSRERNLALARLEESLFWSTAATTRNEGVKPRTDRRPPENRIGKARRQALEITQ